MVSFTGKKSCNLYKVLTICLHFNYNHCIPLLSGIIGILKPQVGPCLSGPVLEERRVTVQIVESNMTVILVL